MKKVFLCVFILFLSVFVFADSYSIKIENADSMRVGEDDSVILEGNVSLSFYTSDDKSSKQRTLTCDKVSVDVNNKFLEATGNVFLSEGKDSKFAGDAVVLNWDSLDVVVFGGKSSSVRNNASGKKVEFYSTGDKISYAGEINTVFFTDGVVGTKETDPYWSIKAQKIGLFDSDMFFEKAWLRLGRVPLLYLPFFYYPGTTLSFNPAVGFSSINGTFLNTTYEVYGSYPALKNASSGSKSYEEGTDNELEGASESILSFMKTDDGEDKIPKGWIYDKYTNDDLSELQTWAKQNGSYLAVTADVYEALGIALGYDTYNSFPQYHFNFTSRGVIAKPLAKDPEFSGLRYAFDLSANYNKDKTKMALSMVSLSDPYVKADFYNRNTVFAFDSIFGREQEFPSSYGTYSSYSWKLNGSTSYSKNNFSFSLSNLSAEVNWAYNSQERKFKIKDALLPSISMKASGTIINKSSSSTKTTVSEEIKYEGEMSELGELKAFDIPAIPGQTKTTEGGLLKATYSTDLTYKDSYSEDFKLSSRYLSANAGTSVQVKVPGSWFSVTENLSSSFLRNRSVTNDSLADNGKVNSTFAASSPKFGLSYKLNSKVWIYTNNGNEVENRTGEWNNKDITAHSISFSKSINKFTFAVSKNLEPLTGKITPSISFSDKGHSVSASLQINPEDESIWDSAKATLNYALSQGGVSFKINNSYDFSKEGWSGYSMSQSLGLSVLNKELKINETMTVKDRFDINKIQITANYKKSSLTVNMKGPELTAENLKFTTSYSQEPVYFWKNRIGFSTSVNGTFIYDFQNKFASSLTGKLSASFAIADFLDLSLAVNMSNSSFYKYYDAEGKFDFKSIVKDLADSFDFIGDGRYRTGFNVSSFSMNIVHYMSDWNLNIDTSAKVGKKDGKYTLVPSMTVMIKWNAIPELKVKHDVEVNLI